MKILIAHRANIDGPDPKYENTVGKVMSTLSKGYAVEIDVWLDKDVSCIRLGHDAPRMNESVPFSFLENPMIYCHAKTMETLTFLQHNSKINVFWQTDSKINLTSRGQLWLHSKCEEEDYCQKSIVTFLGRERQFFGEYKSFYGLCSDYVSEYKEHLDVWY